MGLAEAEWTVVSGFSDQERSLRGLAEALQPDGLSPAGAEQIVNCLIAMEKVAAGVRLELADQASETGSWRSRGARSPAEDLARRTGTSTGTAKDELAASKQIKKQPKVRAALRKGKLSTRQTTEISAAAAANPSAEGTLLEAAGRTDFHGLKEACRKAKAAADPDPECTNRRIHATRYFRQGVDGDGAVVGSFRLTPQAGADLDAFFAPYREAEFAAARQAGRREPYEAVAADALVAMARGSGTSTARGGPGESRVGAPHEVKVLVDFDALVRGHAEPGETCEIGAVAVPVSAVRAILDDAFLVGLLTRGTEVLKVRRFGRHVPKAVRDALRFRDGATCSVEGCSRNARLEMDHVRPCSKDGPTSLDNLQLLCPFHHREKTEHDRLFPADPDPP
jgi:hypothetical protein